MTFYRVLSKTWVMSKSLEFSDRIAKYEMVVVEDGEETSFYVEFIIDIDGLWKISFF